MCLKVTDSQSNIMRDNVTYSDKTVEIVPFEEMNGTIVFLVDNSRMLSEFLLW